MLGAFSLCAPRGTRLQRDTTGANERFPMRCSRIALVLAVAVSLAFPAHALAAVTGGIAGFVHDDTGAPVAGVTITASSPSQVATTTTDVQGHFVFLVLAPDTYTLNVRKDGYRSVSVAGNTVFADQTQQVAITMPRAIRVIATERTNAASLVKPGVGGDLYNVTPAQQEASVALGGGGNMSNAYSAIAAIPGVMVPTGGAGWDQMVVIHGQDPYSTGFEYDGVPVNRAFDNYVSTTMTTLGLQELQVYTGGGPASVASSGISGFINQVIKTGTYPGYADVSGGLATGAFYHQLQFEAGGSTPDRNFSYYVGFSGTDQALRYVTNQNGASQYAPGGPFAYSEDENLFQYLYSDDYGYGVTSACTTRTGPDAGILFGDPVNPSSYYFGCLMNGEPAGIGDSQSFISDREDVVNLHLGLPRRDGQRDDIQLLWSASSMETSFYTSPNDQWGEANMTLTESGEPYNTNPDSFYGDASCAPYCANYPYYNDMTAYNLPFGTPVNDASGAAGLPYEEYYYPASPTDRGFEGELPANAEDPMWNDVGIVKLQWTHPFGDNAYLRLYGYSMYTDWDMIGADTTYADSWGPIYPDAEDYLLTTHTSGGSLDFADQFSDQHLFSVDVNYTTANTSRWYNTGFITGSACAPYINYEFTGTSPQSCASPEEVGLVSQSGGRYTCYAMYGLSPMSPTPCEATQDDGGGEEFNTPYDNANGLYYNSDTSTVEPLPPVTGAAAAAGAQYETVWNSDAQASDNSVTPQFYNVSLSDEWRPNDRWMIDAAVRYDNYNYELPSTQNSQNEFYAQIIQDLACVNPATSTPALTPLAPGTLPPPELAYYQTCPTGYVHPDGVGSDPLFTDVSPPNYDIAYWSARASATYSESPDTVWRFSAGRYVEPPYTASVQYVNSSGNNLGQWGTFMQFGFMSPFHAIPAQTSAQYDLSFEHHFAHTSWSMKLTPFYDYSSNWEQDYFIGPGYVTDIPVGEFRSYGFEAQIQAGDFAANGLSGLFSFAYTNAAVRYQSLMGESSLNQMNTAIEAYDCYTKAYYSANASFCNKNFPQLAASGGASDCYIYNPGSSSAASADPGCPDGDDVLNPYYNQAPQPLLNSNAWWPDPATAGAGLFLGSAYNDAAGFAVPYTATLILNYRVNKFAITPSVQLMTGSKYGSPMDVPGVDPVACAATGENQGPDASDVYTTNNPQDCDYTTYFGGSISPWGTLFVPNPQTGSFASFGEYTEPSIAIANIQLSYDLSPKIRLTLTATDLYHACFGGSKEPWTTANPPGQYICGYDVNSVNYVGGLNGAGAYVGASPNDAANGVTPPAWEEQSYLPQPYAAGSYNAYLPFNIYVQAQIHL
jgi:hypothetical protein